MAHFGKVLVQLRKARRLGQDDLAALSGLSRSLVQTAESSPVPKMRDKNYKRLAAGLGLSAEDLDVAWGQPPKTGPGGEVITLDPVQLAKLKNAIYPFGNAFERWMNQLADYLDENRAFAKQFGLDVLTFKSRNQKAEDGTPPLDIHGAPIKKRMAAKRTKPQ